PDISAIPAALSDTGPKVSSLTTTPVVASIPMPVRATRYSENWMLPLPRAMATPRAAAIAMTANTVDSRPELMPDNTVGARPGGAGVALAGNRVDARPELMPATTVGAGPVRAASAMSRTGARSVDV